MSVAIWGVGFPIQVLHFESFEDWCPIKDVDGNDLVNCQLDFQDDFEFQWVNLLLGEDGLTRHGSDWGSLDRDLIEIINCAGYEIHKVGGVEAVGAFHNLESAQKAMKEKEHLWRDSGGLYIVPVGEVKEVGVIEPEKTTDTHVNYAVLVTIEKHDPRGSMGEYEILDTHSNTIGKAFFTEDEAKPDRDWETA